MTSVRAYLHSLELLGIKLGLDQIRALVQALGHPDRSYRSLVVAGTNGKGSVTAMLERGLRAAGYRTGRYTSPHLTNLEERFAIDGVDVAPDILDAVLGRVQQAAQTLPAPPSYFEATTAAALTLFADAKVDVAVLEVGLGGRLDATNVVPAHVSAITAIDFDHQALLGNTIEAIAREKAGVIKPSTLCVLSANPPPVITIVEETCRAVGARFVLAVAGTGTTVEMRDGRAHVDLQTPVRNYQLALGLRGRHQVDNAVTAVRLLEEVDALGLFAVPAEAIRLAVEDVVWPGRLELVTIGGRAVLIDGAHNEAGAAALAAFLRETYVTRLPIVFGVLRDKDVEAIAGLLAKVASHIVCTSPSSPRAMPPADLAARVAHVSPNMPVDVADAPTDAIARASALGTPVVVAGSLFLAGEVRSLRS